MRNIHHVSVVRRPWAAWLVLCVWVLAALAPVASHALAAAQVQGPARMEVCTTNGAQWVEADAADISAQAPDGPATALVVFHCPFCLQATDCGAAAPPQLPYLFVVQGANQERPVWQAFFVSSAVYLAAAPRGPPAQA